MRVSGGVSNEVSVQQQDNNSRVLYKTHNMGYRVGKVTIE